MPEHRPRRPTTPQGRGFAALWVDLGEASAASRTLDDALGQAGRAYRICRGMGSAVLAFGDYRDCLKLMHDELINTVNGVYWNTLKFGSLRALSR